jgi:membrane-associated HD superfamily phosphohydrolase
LENGQTSPKPIHTEEPLDPFASALKEDNSRIASQKTEADLYEQRKRFVEALNKTQKISEDRVLAEETTAEELNNTREKIDNEINREAGQVINTSSSTEIAKKIVQPVL